MVPELVTAGTLPTAWHAGRCDEPTVDPAVDPRPRDHRQGADGGRRIRQQRRPRPAGRGAGVPAGLVRRAPQHGVDRIVGDERAHRARRRPHEHDPPRRRRCDAAEPLAAHDCRAVRNARDPAPRPDRPRSRASAGLRSEHAAGDASRRPLLGPVPRGRARTPGVPGRRITHSRGRRRARGGDERAAVHPGVVAVRRAARRRTRAPVRIRLPLRTRCPRRCDDPLPTRVPAVGPARRAVRDRGGQRDRRGHRRRGPAAVGDGAALADRPVRDAGS